MRLKMSENETSSIDELTKEDALILSSESLDKTSNGGELLDKDRASPGSEDEWEKPSANSSIVSIISGKTFDSVELLKILKSQNESTIANTGSESLVQTLNEPKSGSSSGNLFGKKENDKLDLSSKGLEVDSGSVGEPVNQGLVDENEKRDNNTGKSATTQKIDIEDDPSTEIGKELRSKEQESEDEDESKSYNEIDIKVTEIKVSLGNSIKIRGSVTPVAHWLVDEVDGDEVVNDSVGGYHAEIVSHSTNVEGEKNDEGIVSQQAEHIEVNHSPSLKPDNGTLTLWFNSKLTQEKATLASCDMSETSVDGGFNLRIYDGSLKLEIEDAEEKVHRISGGNIQEGEWAQVSVSWGSQGLFLFLNGEEIASLKNFYKGLINNNSHWVFGASRSGSSWLAGKQDLGTEETEFFYGAIDDIAIYDHQLNSQEMRGLFENGVEEFMNLDKEECFETELKIEMFVAKKDQDRGLSFLISGLPEGVSLSAGRKHKDGEFRLDQDETDNLKLLVPSNYNDFVINLALKNINEELARAIVMYETGLSAGSFIDRNTKVKVDSEGVDEEPILSVEEAGEPGVSDEENTSPLDGGLEEETTAVNVDSEGVDEEPILSVEKGSEPAALVSEDRDSTDEVADSEKK